MRSTIQRETNVRNATASPSAADRIARDDTRRAYGDECDACGSAPGVLPFQTPDDPVPGGFVVVERCDLCGRYATDLEAAKSWGDYAYREGSGRVIARPRIDAFTRGYIGCAFWSETHTPHDSEGNETGDPVPLEDVAGFDDLAPSAWSEILEDCAAFQRDHADDLAEFEEITGRPDDHAGHDFWLTRNGHGAGFWDRGAGAVGSRLTEAAHVYGTCALYVGDDGRVYAHG